MNKFVIVSFLGDFPNEFLKQYWPIHLTLIWPFQTEKNSEELSELLSQFCATIRRIETVGKSIALFGSNQDVPVIELENTDGLQQLHDNLLKLLSPSISFINKVYPTYRPHVTKKNEDEISQGDRVSIRNVSLVKIENEKRVVICTANLQ